MYIILSAEKKDINLNINNLSNVIRAYEILKFHHAENFKRGKNKHYYLYFSFILQINPLTSIEFRIKHVHDYTLKEYLIFIDYLFSFFKFKYHNYKEIEMLGKINYYYSFTKPPLIYYPQSERAQLFTHMDFLGCYTIREAYYHRQEFIIKHNLDEKENQKENQK